MSKYKLKSLTIYQRNFKRPKPPIRYEGYINNYSPIGYKSAYVTQEESSCSKPGLSIETWLQDISSMRSSLQSILPSWFWSQSLNNASLHWIRSASSQSFEKKTGQVNMGFRYNLGVIQTSAIQLFHEKWYVMASDWMCLP